jgi:hypothetical protein
MTRTITLPDETYQRLERLAASLRLTAEDMLVSWLPLVEEVFTHSSEEDPLNADPQSPYQGIFWFLRGLGLDEESLAHIQTLPAKDQPTEVRLAMRAIADEQAGRDPLKEPRYQTFGEFFHDLGMTDEQIADAQRRSAERANL